MGLALVAVLSATAWGLVRPFSWMEVEGQGLSDLEQEGPTGADSIPLVPDGVSFRIHNREIRDRYMRQDGDGNVFLSQEVDRRCNWVFETHVKGMVLKNHATGRYLQAENWEVFASEDLKPGCFWRVEDNQDGSVSLQNVASERFLDGDGAVDDWDVDESEEVKEDDGWFLEVRG